jgi:hypothetical protein
VDWRRIRFPAIRGRTYGYNAVPAREQPVPPGTSPRQLPPAGGQPDAISERTSRYPAIGEGGSPGRSYLGRTEDALNSGPAPDRIDRAETPKHSGTILPGTGESGGMAGWPYDGNALFIPHQRIPRKPITVTPFQRTIDTSVTVPSIGVGNPVG